MKFNLPRAKRKLDKIFKDYISNRDHNQCQSCGKTEGRMNVAHLIPRTVCSLRWSKINAVLLCFRCHIKWHESPLESAKWLEEKLGIVFINALLKQSKMPYKFTKELYEQTKKELTEQ